jgi:CHASE3 domain sensor protein
MKIRDKLFAGFLIVVLMTAGMGLYAIHGVNRL